MNGHVHLNGAPNGPNGHHRYSRWTGFLRLMIPGVGLKRWMLLGASGISVCSIGLAYLLYKIFALGLPNFLPGYMEGVFLLGMGILVIMLALYGLYRSVGPLILASRTLDDLARTIYTRRALGRGPRIVAIGGGTGLSVLLRGLKAYTDNLTAIVTVGDDGGSSGRLRKDFGMLPPGDFRNCLVAMSDAESLVTELFQYRFDQGNGLKGHSFGNLFIAALTNVTDSFEQALYESSRVLAVHGQIVPATVANLRLSAKLLDGRVINGESKISEAGGEIDHMFIDPYDAEAHPLAVEAIRDAQVIVIGPGSLYTSILPNLMVKGISEAMHKSNAIKIYVSNVATQKGETEGYSVADHHEALKKHTFPSIVDYVVANDTPVELGPDFYGTPVRHGGQALKNARLELATLTSPDHPVRHDSQKLAQTVMAVYHRGNKLKPLRKLRKTT